jgi:uncharacterized protein
MMKTEEVSTVREENVATLRRGYEAFARKDLGTIRETFASDCVWYTPGIVFDPEYKGMERSLEYLSKLIELSGGTFKAEPEAFLADDEHVVVIERVTGTRSGKTLDSRVVHVYRLRDGKVAEVTEYQSEPKKTEPFWS